MLQAHMFLLFLFMYVRHYAAYGRSMLRRLLQ